jgi:hypothetical protein
MIRHDEVVMNCQLQDIDRVHQFFRRPLPTRLSLGAEGRGPLPFALIALEPCHTNSCPQFPGLCSSLTCDGPRSKYASRLAQHSPIPPFHGVRYHVIFADALDDKCRKRDRAKLATLRLAASRRRSARWPLSLWAAYTRGGPRLNIHQSPRPAAALGKIRSCEDPMEVRRSGGSSLCGLPSDLSKMLVEFTNCTCRFPA